MGYAAVSIPEKIFFKIGEVCDIVDVQAHVLRYWETEFPQLSPQKNRSGQRSYRRRDVEIALRIKELLYVDEYTIAGARKKLQNELRESSRLKIVPNEPVPAYIQPVEEESVPDFEAELDGFEEDVEDADVQPIPVAVSPRSISTSDELPADRRQALTELASQLLELREMLRQKTVEDAATFQRR